MMMAQQGGPVGRQLCREHQTRSTASLVADPMTGLDSICSRRVRSCSDMLAIIPGHPANRLLRDVLSIDLKLLQRVERIGSA